MLDSVLTFFQAEIGQHLKNIPLVHNIGFPSFADTGKEAIDLIGTSGEKGLKMMIINLEEEKLLHQDDKFSYKTRSGSFKGFPEIRLNIYLLFISDLENYLKSMEMLSHLIKYFQARRVFDATNFPNFPDDLHRLTAELVTLNLNEQNEIWNALRTSYKPYVLYKIRMVVFTPIEPHQKAPGIVETMSKINA